MDMNAESVLDALNDFERKPVEIPPILEDYLLRVAQNGEIIFPWCKLKPLLKKKLETVCDEFRAANIKEIKAKEASSEEEQVQPFDNYQYETLKKSILQAVDAFTSAPFTIQRLCELVTNPKKHYNRSDKYMRGIEKNVLVVSTVEPRIIQNDANANVNPVVNGLLRDSPRDDDCFNNHENTDVSSSNLNTPANHVLLDNFANVFPSAACIPSPSNICISTEIDSNFIPNAECVESQEKEFDPPDSMELSHVEPKEEQMDTTNEDQNCPDDKSEVTSPEVQLTVETEKSKVIDTEQSSKIEELVEDSTVSETAVDNTSTSDDNVSTSDDNVSTSDDNVKNEADCSDSLSEENESEKEISEPNQCQQDDTVSQSDDNVCDVNEISHL